ELLRQRPARGDGRRFSRFLRHLFRYDGGPSLCFLGRRRKLDADCARSSSGTFGGSADSAMIRVELPFHLRTLARVEGEVELHLQGEITLGSVLDALEQRYPVLRGTIRDQVTKKRRPFLRFFACETDLSHDPPDTPLPGAVVRGEEPFLVVGA